MRTYAADTVEIEKKYAKLEGKVLPDARVCGVQELVYGVDMLGDVGVLATELASAGT
jgi:hypothetical protein